MATQPDLGGQYMTRKEYIETTLQMLKGVLTVPVLRLVAYDAAANLQVPASVVDALLAQPAGAAPVAGAKPEAGKPGRKKKGEAAPGEEGKAKRAGKINTYTMFVTWFLDYCSHYGKNPKVQAMKDANPTLGKVQLAAHAYQTLSDAGKVRTPPAPLRCVCATQPHPPPGSGATAGPGQPPTWS